MGVPEPYWADEDVTLHLGDCLAVLATMEEGSVDAIVTDPPYGIGFMGKEWDSGKAFVERKADKRNTFDHVGGNHNPVDSADAARTRRVEGQRFGAWCEVWAAECLRVLKPGGWFLAFGGTRTWHRLVCGIEDAGFEIRDSIDWIYGSGFPKSLDVSKAIDKAGGNPLAFREFARAFAAIVAASPLTYADIDRHLGIKASSCFWTREDHRGGMPPRHHWAKVCALLSLPAELERLYDAAEREVVATGYRVRRESTVQIVGLSDGEYDITAPASEDATRWEGWGTALKPAHEPIAVARKPLAGTVARNVLEHGTGALNVDGCRVAGGKDVPASPRRAPQGPAYGELGNDPGTGSGWDGSVGRWPPNVVLGPAAAAELDRQSGVSASRIGKPRRSGAPGDGYGMVHTGAEYGDAGGASRFFPVFRYEAKAAASERPRAEDGTAHPTVKPVDLMAWLVRLVTPPGGLVLDPFAGSGTTGEACVVEGFRCILVEKDPKHAELIKARLSKPIQPAMFGFDEAS